jgi:hypothetical protein
MAVINILKSDVRDEQSTVTASIRSPVIAILGKLNLSAAGPKKKKDMQYVNETTLNENLASVMSVWKD